MIRRDFTTRGLRRAEGGKAEPPCVKRIAAPAACACLTATLLACGIASGVNSASGAEPAAVSGSGQEMAADDLPAASSRGSFSKSQVVYAKLDAAGTPEGVFVVNSFESDGGAAVQDLGLYDEVVNLTDSQDIASVDGIARFEVDGRGRFRYQGNLPASTQLPWNVRATYSIDGERRDAAELAGAAGHLKMTLEISPVDGAEGALAGYADNCLLQVSGSLDSDACRSISAPDATIAEAGSSMGLTYMVFPGKSASYTVEADVEDFSFGGWTIAGVPLSIALDVDDGDLSKVSDETAELKDAVSQLSSGSSELSGAISGNLVAGLEQMGCGSAAYRNELGEQAGQLRGQGDAVDVDGPQAAFEQALADYMASYVGSYTQGYTADLVSGYTAAYTERIVASYAQAYTQAFASAYAESLVAAYTPLYTGAYTQALLAAYTPVYTQQYAELVKNGTASDAAVAQASAYAASQVDTDTTALAQSASAAAMDQVDAQSLAQASAQQAAASVDVESLAGAASPDALAGLDLATMAEAASADAMADGAVAALQADFADALAELVTAQATKAGLGSAADALSGAQSGYAQLDDGVQGVLDASSPKGVYTLAEAARQLAEGAGELTGRTADIDQQLIAGIRRELQSYLNPDYETVDFASPSNDHTVAVQFVLMTASIEI